ncbi:MAG: DUF7901 domain-containing protein, partial [Planctomycetota bacterium]
WSRFTITNVPLNNPDWNGEGSFEDGETEDYLLRVDDEPVPDIDFGDAPDPCYPTLLASDGARHVIGGPYFCDAGIGDSPDPEPEGLQHPTALGDDLDADGDDEDGVVVPPLLFHLLPQTIFLNVCGAPAAGAAVQIWIDYNRDGDWDDAGEQVHNAFLGDGPHNIGVTAPAGSAVGQTFVRCRISTAGGLSPTGQADDGEVEDHETRLIAVDYGDAPDPCYPTLVTSNGARHSIVSGAPWLGPNDDGPDADGDGQPDPQALGDDGDIQGDDEDGVTIPALTIGVPTDISVEVSGGGGWVYGWIDFNADGDWDDAGEMVVSGNLPDGVNVISVTAPAGSAIGTTFARFRIISSSIASPTPRNWWNDGEVEDLELQIWPGPKPPTPHLKWSQPPIEIDPNIWPPVYCGWDEPSWTTDPYGTSGFDTNTAADDFRCLGSMPITSIHWWGSHVHWQGVDPPTLTPIAGWWIRFYSNVPAIPGADPNYSYPEHLLWEVQIDDVSRVQWEWAGLDEFPDRPYDTCFQYYLDLDPEEWFWQAHFLERTIDDVFWINIQAIYPPDTDPIYPWGWKTRPWHWMDDAVRYECRLVDGVTHCRIVPIKDTVWGESYDLAFELDTDPNYIKWEQAYDSIHHWPHYEDEYSMAQVYRFTEIKWSQYPDLEPGVSIDVDATADLAGFWPPQIIADDFNCTSPDPITDIHLWASWFGDELPFDDANNVIFTLSIHDDIPKGAAADYSMPGDVLWWRQFHPGQFNASIWDTQLDEGWYSPCTDFYEQGVDTVCWKYDFYIDPWDAFHQEGTLANPVVYWLDVQAEPQVTDNPWIRFGWKTSMDHWNDDGVWSTGYEPYPDPWNELRYPIGHPYETESIDLAFEITGESEDMVIHRMVADDWPCEANTPITAAVWWGSYLGYHYEPCTDPWPRPTKPDYFLLTIWTDVPADSCDPTSYSHPGRRIWTYNAYDYDEVLVGYDKHPEASGSPGASAAAGSSDRYSLTPYLSEATIADTAGRVGANNAAG